MKKKKYSDIFGHITRVLAFLFIIGLSSACIFAASERALPGVSDNVDDFSQDAFHETSIPGDVQSGGSSWEWSGPGDSETTNYFENFTDLRGREPSDYRVYDGKYSTSS